MSGAIQQEVGPNSAFGRRALSLLVVLVVSATSRSDAQIVAFEGNNFPESTGWTPTPFCDPPRILDNGWFQQEVAPCPGDPLPGGQQESFTRNLGVFVESSSFFLEWRMLTDGPSTEIIGVAPASIVIAGNFGTNYHFTVARDEVRMIRDNLLPILYQPISEDAPHAYRLELYAGDLYVLYIDGQVVEAGTPEGKFPENDSAVISFRAKCWYEASTTRWDYIRFGVIPADASGDYNSDGLASLDDFYFIHECLTNDRPGIKGGPGNDAGPGCRFTDFDGDTDVDQRDIAVFQREFVNPS